MTKKVHEVIDLLKSEGWEHMRTKGDHRIFVKPGQPRPIVVPGKLSDDLPVGTWYSIRRALKQEH